MKETIETLKAFFESQDQNLCFSLTPIEKVLNLGYFWNTHYKFLKANTGNKTYLPYWNRLIKAKELLINWDLKSKA
jgi:hypothetical protein